MKNKVIYTSPKLQVAQFEFEDCIAGASVTKTYDTEFNNAVQVIDWKSNEVDAPISNESWF